MSINVRKHILRACVAALLGVVTSVLVTWTMVYEYMPGRRWPLYFSFEVPADVPLPKGHTFAWLRQKDATMTYHRFTVCERDQYVANPIYSPRPARWESLPGVCVAAIRRHQPLLESKHGELLVFNAIEFGWPWRCLAYEDACMPSDLTSQESNLVNGVLKPAISDDEWPLKPYYFALEIGGKQYPWRPTIGLIANAAFFGSVWFVVLFAVSHYRNGRRTTRFECSCGYPLRGLSRQARCPECGAALPIVR